MVDAGVQQTSFSPVVLRSQRRETLDGVVDSLRRRFGCSAIQRCVQLEEPALAIHPKQNPPIHPVSFRR